MSQQQTTTSNRKQQIRILVTAEQTPSAKSCSTGYFADKAAFIREEKKHGAGMQLAGPKNCTFQHRMANNDQQTTTKQQLEQEQEQEQEQEEEQQKQQQGQQTARHTTNSKAHRRNKGASK